LTPGHRHAIGLQAQKSLTNLTYTGVDLLSLTLLSKAPTLFLLTRFYSIRPTTALTSLTVDLLTTYIPFRLLRPLSPAHKAISPIPYKYEKRSALGLFEYASTSVTAAALYAVTVYTGLYTFLPHFFVVYFYGIKDISFAHAASIGPLFLIFLPLGVAANAFIFVPAAAVPDLVSGPGLKFDTVSSTLWETIMYNLWTKYTDRTKVVLKRTAVLTVVSSFNTFLHSWVALKGVEFLGALAWGSTWEVAGVLTGLFFLWTNTEAPKV
jgi:hypothetical protein